MVKVMRTYYFLCQKNIRVVLENHLACAYQSLVVLNVIYLKFSVVVVVVSSNMIKKCHVIK